MKKILVLLLVLSMSVAMFAAEDLKSVDTKTEAKYEVKYSRNDIPAPPSQFVTNPVDLIDNYYDYQIGNYSAASPLKYQSDEHGGGMYMFFHGMQTADATRRCFYGHIAADGTVTGPSFTSSNDLREGYGGLGVDPVTGDPLWAFHADMNADGFYDYCFGYDQYHIIQGPGLPAGPFFGINGADLANTPLDFTGNEDMGYEGYDHNTIATIGKDEFIWPKTYIGTSPVEGKRRVYIISRNYSQGAGGVSSNAVLARADFDVNDLDGINNLEWEYISFEYFDNMHLNETQDSPYYSFAVGEDGRVAIFGLRYGDAVDATHATENLESYVLYSNDYGDTWTVKEENLSVLPTCMLEMEDGTPVIEDYEEGTMRADLDQGGMMNFNPVFDDDNNLQAPVNFQMIWSTNGSEDENVFPYSQLLKSVKFDFETEEFSLTDVFPTANQGTVGIPWDVDGDGNIDEFSDEGSPLMTSSWPQYFWDRLAPATVEDNVHTTVCHDDNTMAVVWNDSWKSYQYNDVGDETYSDYAEAPEIMIAFSEDNGDTWYSPLRLSSVENTELEGVIPEYVYPANEIKKVGEHTYQLSLMWLDDNTYGSHISMTTTPNDGGIVQYATIEVTLDGSDSNVEVPNTSLRSYPNPFSATAARSEVNISFDMPEAGHAKVSVYNVKGQLVKTVFDAQANAKENNLTWNTKDNNNNEVSSGIYFYKLETANTVEMNKMIILK